MAKLSTGGSVAPSATDDPSETMSPPSTAVRHYTRASDMPPTIQKYFHQRHNLFSLYDEGVRLTDAAWYGVTPEPIALRIADDLSTLPDAIDTAIDIFCGVGGNTIALARSGRFRHIFGIERDEATLRCAENNARVYGVEKKITFILGDCFDVVPRRLRSVLKKAVIFGSPPWGGVEYGATEVFDVQGMQPYGLDVLGGLAKGAAAQCWYLPRTTDLNQLALWKVAAGVQGRVKVVHYCVGGSSKALCMYVGDYQWEQ